MLEGETCQIYQQESSGTPLNRIENYNLKNCKVNYLKLSIKVYLSASQIVLLYSVYAAYPQFKIILMRR